MFTCALGRFVGYFRAELRCDFFSNDLFFHRHSSALYLPKKEADGKSYVKYQVIGNNSVAVPTHFYKVVVGEKTEGKLDLESYVMPNQVIDDKTPLAVFQVNKIHAVF